MKRPLCLIVLIVCLGTAVAPAMTYLGPPTTRAAAGKWSIGGLYSESEQDIEFEHSIEFDDVEERAAAAIVSVGLADKRAELYGIFGGADIEQDGFEADDKFLGGLGGRITTNLVSDEFAWGIAGQFTYVKSESSSVILGVNTPYELRTLDIQIGFGPCWRPGPFTLYGGPYIHWVEGEIETTEYGDFDINVESWFGAYIGGGVDLAEHVSLLGEVQATPDATGFAIAGQFRF
jgi:hypothetical protein